VKFKRLLCDGEQHLTKSLKEKCFRIKVSIPRENCMYTWVPFQRHPEAKMESEEAMWGESQVLDIFQC
jgi:hypothetical protein